MKSHVSTAALALLLIAGTAFAQERQPQGQQGGGGAERGGGQADPGAGQGARGGGGEGQRGEGKGQSDGREAPSRGQAQGQGQAGERTSPGGSAGTAGQGQSVGDRGKEQRRTTKEPREKNEQTTRQRQQSSDREKAQRNRAEAKDGKADAKERSASDRAKTQQQKAQEQKGSSQRRGDAQPSRDRAGEGAGAGQVGQAGQGQQGQVDQGQANQTDRERNARGADPSRAGDANRGARERAEISDSQRERVRTVIREQRPRRAANINVDIDIGRRLPRTVELRPLPRRVVEIVPAYRSYRYVYVDDRIVIVDPGTYEVVYVIDEDTNRGRAQRSARAGGGTQVQLELTQSERQVLFQFVEYDRARADIQFRLGLGAEVPQNVELLEFPVEVLDRIRKLESYRYVVVERTVLVVDPRDRQIELVVEPR